MICVIYNFMYTHAVAFVVSIVINVGMLFFVLACYPGQADTVSIAYKCRVYMHILLFHVHLRLYCMNMCTMMLVAYDRTRSHEFILDIYECYTIPMYIVAQELSLQRCAYLTPLPLPLPLRCQRQ